MEDPEPTNSLSVDDEKAVDRTVPDGDAIATTTPNNVPSQRTTDTRLSSCWKRFVTFYGDNEFLILIVLSICLAKAYPPLGAQYLANEITASWIAVIIIFSESSFGSK